MENPYRDARMSLAVVIEHLPYGCELAQDCVALITKLRDQEAHDLAQVAITPSSVS